MNKMQARMHRHWASLALLILLSLTAQEGSAQAPGQKPGAAPALELIRPVRPWEFLSAVGQRAGIFGAESGRIEAWVYPLKILRDFRLVFLTATRTIPAEALVRTIIARPESTTLVYAGDAFTVRETFFIPVRESGAVIALEIETYEPLQVEAQFVRDFQLIWPAGLGGTYMSWDADLRAFSFGEESRQWFALVGSPAGEHAQAEYETSYSASQITSFRLPSVPKGRSQQLIVIAGSAKSRDDVIETYRRLASDYPRLLAGSAAYYRDLLSRTTSLELPDPELQRAYDWARISVAQGLVENPFLGTGLIAGYRTSGTSGRPGFAWFFGRDSEWTSLALTSMGAFDITRTALEFLSKYQRQDGKIPHEISQAARQVPWFTNYPYPWASADATPLYIIAVEDYVRHSGDLEFARTHWDNVWRAYQFLRSTYGESGLPRNIHVGHGWIEGGPLMEGTPLQEPRPGEQAPAAANEQQNRTAIKTELYQAGLGAEALRALAALARDAGKQAVAAQLDQEFQDKRKQLDQLFWVSDKKIYGFAVNQQNQAVATASVLSTVPMWFGLLDPDNSQEMINKLAATDHATDWGMRIISSSDPNYSPAGYHFGSVWPLFTGWASVGEYRYHRPLPAFANLRANALLGLSGAAGHTTEVLSGAYFEPISTSSPHQIWSAAMTISPMLRGLVGFEADLPNAVARFAPHVPADWNWFRANQFRVGTGKVDLEYRRDGEGVTLIICAYERLRIHVSLPFSLRARITGAELHGKAMPLELERTATDQHASLRLYAAVCPTVVRVNVQRDFGIAAPISLPPLGESSRGIRIVSESWSANANQVDYEVEGIPGAQYDLPVRGAEQIADIQGGELMRDTAMPRLRVRIPGSGSGYQRARVTIRFRR